MFYKHFVIFMACYIIATNGYQDNFISTNGYQHNLKTKELIVCENDSNLIQCPPRTTIKIISTNYGRSGSRNVCGISKDVQCFAPSSISIVFQKCDGKKGCYLEANNGIFGDPCPNVGKYLRVAYICQSKSHLDKF
ncbi:D-galactoside-specific lectin-like [Aethina tumida]|uniref:D-galactoside-specific lectin-like n=1 Tax=Aethina tumida TaxID=116153 RepID=UPI002147F77F|nr:D-galactoside-specific lectin-like [Aethina tumida]